MSAARDGHRGERLRQAREIEERVGVPTCRKLPLTVGATSGPPGGGIRSHALGDDACGDAGYAGDPSRTASGSARVFHRGYFTDGLCDR